jgi:hypothetical protein
LHHRASTPPAATAPVARPPPAPPRPAAHTHARTHTHAPPRPSAHTHAQAHRRLAAAARHHCRGARAHTHREREREKHPHTRTHTRAHTRAHTHIQAAPGRQVEAAPRRVEFASAESSDRGPRHLVVGVRRQVVEARGGRIRRHRACHTLKFPISGCE